jgi:magnesium-transporting ATPase (P-type)
VPVDGIIIEGHGVLCDESAMTGESEQMKKESLEVCK